MRRSIFEFTDYKAYLNDRLDDRKNVGRGSRSRLAEALKCQTSYIAQVLRGNAHLNPDQAEAANAFLGHTEGEGDYFQLLVQLARAATPVLRGRIERQMSALRTEHMVLQKRLGVGQPLSVDQQARFYSAWYYSAIRAFISVPGNESAVTLAQRLGLDAGKISAAVKFLLECGLLKEGKSGLEIGEQRTHLGSDSPLISKHHMNWRLQAMRAIENAKSENLHYSSVVSLSHQDAASLRERMVEFISDAKKVIQASPAERVQVFSLDFFEL